ncbi:MAG: hypothetical protein IJJ89_03640 [Eubacterium sp.]|nr:hypothetical protein [Eubacterium sp.]MBR6217095.1 hypothetical protein [Eubacterium sp.]
MYQQDVVLCSASRYTRKYYLNPDFQNLPDEVQKELKVMCVLFTEDVGGIILLMFDENGNLRIVTDAEEDDILFDEIGCDLKVRQLQKTKRELFEQLEEYYNTFF